MAKGFSGGFGETSGKPAAPMSRLTGDKAQSDSYSGAGSMKSEDGSKGAAPISKNANSDPGMRGDNDNVTPTSDKG